MRFILIISLIVFPLFYVSAQSTDTLNRVDAQGLKYGLWKKPSKAGGIDYVGFFKEGYPIGEFTYYHSNGKIKTVLINSNKGRRAYAKMYAANGITLIGEGLYINKKKDSVWKYYGDQKALMKEEAYKNGKPNGVWKTYYPTGEVFEVTNYVDSVKNGEWKQFFKNGNPKLEAKYVKGQLDGAFKIYYQTGRLKLYGVYRKSMRIGNWTNYSEDGKPGKVNQYVDGVLLETEAERKARMDKFLEEEKNGRPNTYVPGSTVVPSDSTAPANNEVKPEDYY